MLFASDGPLIPKAAPCTSRDTIRAIDNLKITDIDREHIYYKNALKLLGME